MASKYQRKTTKKSCFLVILDHFSYKDRPNDLVRRFFSSLDIGPYILPTCRPLRIFLDSFGGAQMENLANFFFNHDFQFCPGTNRPCWFLIIELKEAGIGVWGV
jgi:hypothetical protein